MTLEELLILHEGLEYKPYVDTVGKITIGVGRNLTDRGISKDEVLYLLNNDIAIVKKECVANFPWFNTLNEARQMVILDMAFNMGTPKLKTFKNTLKAVEEKRWIDAANGMLASKWAQQVGQRAKRLATMMMTGEVPIG